MRKIKLTDNLRKHLAFTPGIRFMIAAAFFYSVMAVFVKLAGSRLPSQEIVFVRSFLAFLMTFFLIKKGNISITGKRRGLLILRAIFGFFGLSAFFYTLTVLPIADSTLLLYTNPLITALIAPFILKEVNTNKQWGLYLAGFLGIILIIKPTFSLDPYATIIGLSGAVCTSIAYVTVRILGKSDHEFTIILYFSGLATLASLPETTYSFVWPTIPEWLALLGVGIATQIAQVFMTRGLHRETAARATNVGYMNVLFSIGWGLLIWDQFPDPLAITGAGLIIISVFFVNRS
ncbi:MAG: DMT family transporter [Calditrichaceae bacterium]